MIFGEMNWRPQLRQIGWARKGEEWRCWLAGLKSKVGEEWYEEVTLSLIERWHMAAGYGYKDQLAVYMRDWDVYQIVHLDDLFKFVLHLPRPLAEILDEMKIPRTRTLIRFNPMFGPPPEFHGPLSPSGIVPFEARYVPSPEGFQVQPMQDLIKHLPLSTPFPDYMAVLKELIELHPLKLPE